MTFKILISKTAYNFLQDLPRELKERIKSSLMKLGEDPYKSRSGVDIKRLEGTTPQKYRLRVGKYRIVYTVIGENEVRIIEVFKRGRGYRGI